MIAWASFYASLKTGHVTASVALKWLVAFSTKNRFYRAIRELSRIFKTELILQVRPPCGSRPINSRVGAGAVVCRATSRGLLGRGLASRLPFLELPDQAHQLGHATRPRLHRDRLWSHR